MTDASTFSIKEHAKVVSSDGQHIGTVDHMDGDRIKLAKNDSKGISPGVHVFVPFSLIGAVDADGTVRLKVDAAKAKTSVTQS